MALLTALRTALRTVRRSSALGAEEDGPGTAGASFHTPILNITLQKQVSVVAYREIGTYPDSQACREGEYTCDAMRGRGLRPQKSQRLRGLRVVVRRWGAGCRR